MITDALRRRATELGVQLSYEDVDQVVHDADPEVVARVVEILDGGAGTTPSLPHVHLDPRRPVPIAEAFGPATDAELVVDGSPTSVTITDGTVVLPDGLPLGCHTLVVDGRNGAAESLIVVAPPSMPGGESTDRTSSLFAPAYALWDDDRPLPSFGLLQRLAHHAASAGVDTIATLPLYATFLDEPFDPSPYSPISRLHWNEVFLDDDGLPDEPVPDQGENVEWRELGARRRRQLITAAVDADDDLLATLARFTAAHPDVGSYARFMAARESSGDAVVERSHVLGQFLADQQLAALAADDSAAALSLDLPIGSHPDGWETWAHPNLFADAMSVGAPPDTFFTEGQNWGFPPQLPAAMNASGYELWRQMIARAGRHASMLRIDHVMAVHRLWWVPTGQSADRGVYVTYPHQELLAVIAASAAAAGLTVVGENLGTVPPEVDRALTDWKM
ncbi:MAG: 4-alpha-glucanotransferase, partial [Ilumatobacter sp.]|uniref:4-alpha-glucanotransferase n=1 Tax=Ilumatobacter sp. TaxID=1967498 RepID=UPI003C73E761